MSIERRAIQLAKQMNPQDNLERLLENLILMLGKTNNRVMDLNRRVAKLEERQPQ